MRANRKENHKELKGAEAQRVKEIPQRKSANGETKTRMTAKEENTNHWKTKIPVKNE